MDGVDDSDVQYNNYYCNKQIDFQRSFGVRIGKHGQFHVLIHYFSYIYISVIKDSNLDRRKLLEKSNDDLLKMTNFLLMKFCTQTPTRVLLDKKLLAE